MTATKDKLVKQAQKISQRIELDKSKMKAVQQQIKDQERKQRTRELIQIGGIVEIAGLRETDKGVLLGLLLHSKQLLEDKETYGKLKALGDSELNKRAQKRSRKNKAKNG